MSTAEHADLEVLSAFVDGEAPEWADHVAGCPRCRATAADLRAMAATVAAPVSPPPAARREAAIAAALGAMEAGAGARPVLEPAAGPAVGPAIAARHQAERARFARRMRWSPGSWAMPAVAAVVVALLGLSGVILSANRATDENATTFAGPALDAKTESAVPGAPTAPAGDLGDVPDAATLRARALGVAADTSTGFARSSASSGAASESPAAAGAPPAQSSATNTGNTGASITTGAAAGGAGGAGGGAATLNSPPSAAGGSSAIIPNAVGTRPCEERARAREPGLGPVTYFATARRGTVPAYVLGFATSGGGPVTLLMLAQDGCAELLRSVGP